MARDGSGTYSLPAGNPVSTGTTVSSTTHNSTMSDIASALTASIAKDGQTTPTANLPMGTYKHTGVGNGSARDQYAAIAQIQDGGVVYAGSVSGTDTIIASLTPAIASYATGMCITFTPANTNTGPVTLALNGLTAKSIVAADGNNLLAGDLRAGVPAELVYNGTNFILVSNYHIAGTFTAQLNGVSGTVTVTAQYSRNGRVVTLYVPAMTGTSNSNNMSINGLPTAIQTAIASQMVAWPGGTDAGVENASTVWAVLASATPTAIALWRNGSAAGWTASGTKGIQGTTFSYLI